MHIASAVSLYGGRVEFAASVLPLKDVCEENSLAIFLDAGKWIDDLGSSSATFISFSA